MFILTHQEARRLLQSDADQTLGADDKSALDAHLATCQACSNYANSLTALEANLRRVLHTHLDSQHPSLDLQAITNPAYSTWRFLFNPTHTLGKMAIVATLLLGYFIISNLFGGQLPITENKTPTIIPTPNNSSSVFTNSPTPSSPSTLVGLTQGCETIHYVAQPDDTLENIALQFGVSEKMIAEYNNLKLDDLDLAPGLELSIPVCNRRPSQTASIHTNTMTLTPLTKTVLPTQQE